MSVATCARLSPKGQLYPHQSQFQSSIFKQLEGKIVINLENNQNITSSGNHRQPHKGVSYYHAIKTAFKKGHHTIMRMLPSRRPSPSMAACGRALTRFSSFVLILMVASMPFVHSSRTSFPGRKSVAEQRAIVTQEVGRNLLKGSVGNGGAVFNVEEREVPTGPDPLHHNNNPTVP